MKVLYDDIIFRLQKVGGISNVFSQLISFAIKDESIELGHISTTRGEIKNIFWKELEITKPIYFKNISRILLQFIPISFIDTKCFSIFHATYYNFPIKKNNIKFVITIHDLGYERGLMQKGIKRFVNIFFKRLAIIQADGIICVSQSTFNDLFIYYGKHLNNKQIAVIHNGISNKFKNLDYSSNTFSRNVLFVGGRQRYKNFKNLVRAIAISNEYNLVILGGGNLSKNHLKFILF
jgi:mannosyltransferase